MQTAEEKRNVEAFTIIIDRIINNGELDLCERYMAETMDITRYGNAAIFSLLNPGPAPANAGSIAGYKAGLTLLRTAFPDWHHDIVSVFAKDDWVSGIWRLTCTHTKPFLGLAPTGNKINVEEAGFMRFENGRMVGGWFMIDELTFARQLGIECRPL